MHTSAPSRIERVLAAGVVHAASIVIGGTLIAFGRPAAAQVSTSLTRSDPQTQALPSSTPPPSIMPPLPPLNARTRIEAAGPAALERLKAARARQQAAGSGYAASLNVVAPADPRLAKRAAAALQHQVRPTNDLTRRAVAAAATADSPAMIKAKADMRAQLARSLGLEGTPLAAVGASVKPPSGAPGTWTPVIFASSSMPISTLRAYAVQLEPLHGVIAFRGVPGGMKTIGPFAKLSAEILRVDPACSGPDCVMRATGIIVDPIVFRAHGVTRVPALTLAPGDAASAYCERPDEAARGRHVIYGDSALAGLFDEYARLGGKQEVDDVQSRKALR